MSKWFIYCLIAGLCCLGAPWAQAENLVEVSRMVRSADPLVVQAMARLAAEQENYIQTRAGLLPRMDASAGITYFTHDIENYTTGQLNGDYTGHNLGVSLRQPILNGQAWKGLEQAAHGIRAAEYATVSAEQDTLLKGAEAYLAALRAAASEAVAEREQARLAEILRQAAAALEVGTGDIISVHEALSRFEGAKASLESARAERRYAERRLSVLAGRSLTVAALNPRLGAPAAPPGEVAERAVETSPAVRQAKAYFEQAETEIEIARRGHWPTLDMTAGYSDTKGSTFIPDMEIRQWTIGGALTFPLFRGGATQSQVRQAVARRTEAKGRLDEVHQSIRQRVELARARWEAASGQLAAASRQVDAAEKTVRAVAKGREIGVRTIVDLMNAEQSLFAAQRSHEAARIDLVLSHLQLRAAAGVLSEEDLAAAHSQG